jgi:large subunit ribosomal protein L21e
MTHSYGYRRKTRSKFSRPFKDHGTTRISKFLTPYRIGDYVDIVVDGAQHKGMPYKFYHGRTGRVFNVNPRSVGVRLFKVVGNHYQEKRIHVRVEHLQKSQTREAFKARIKENDKKKAEARKAGKTISTKRQVVGPRDATYFKAKTVEFQQTKFFKEIF